MTLVEVLKAAGRRIDEFNNRQEEESMSMDELCQLVGVLNDLVPDLRKLEISLAMVRGMWIERG
jgi:hypothetical protein